MNLESPNNRHLRKDTYSPTDRKGDVRNLETQKMAKGELRRWLLFFKSIKSKLLTNLLDLKSNSFKREINHHLGS